MSAGLPRISPTSSWTSSTPERVSLRRAFREILPLLPGLKAGAMGSGQAARAARAEFVHAEGTNFVVLLERPAWGRHLLKALAGRTGLSHVFIVTDADESFKGMAQDVRDGLAKACPAFRGSCSHHRDYLLSSSDPIRAKSEIPASCHIHTYSCYIYIHTYIYIYIYIYIYTYIYIYSIY